MGTLLTGASNAGVVGRNRDFEPVSGSLRAVNAVTTRCYQHVATGPWQVVTLIAGSKWWSLLMAGDNDEVFMTGSLNVMSTTTEQHLIVHSDKSVAYVTNNTSYFIKQMLDVCTTEAIY